MGSPLARPGPGDQVQPGVQRSPSILFWVSYRALYEMLEPSYGQGTNAFPFCPRKRKHRKTDIGYMLWGSRLLLSGIQCGRPVRLVVMQAHG